MGLKMQDKNKENNQEIKVISYKPKQPVAGTRWKIVDKLDESKVLDDTQGYGYKTPQNAYKAWGWKHRSSKAKKKEGYTKHWMKTHKDICDSIIDDYFFELKNDPENFEKPPLREHLKAYNVPDEEIDKLNLSYLRKQL